MIDMFTKTSFFEQNTLHFLPKKGVISTETHRYYAIVQMNQDKFGGKNKIK